MRQKPTNNDKWKTAASDKWGHDAYFELIESSSRSNNRSLRNNAGSPSGGPHTKVSVIATTLAGSASNSANLLAGNASSNNLLSLAGNAAVAAQALATGKKLRRGGSASGDGPVLSADASPPNSLASSVPSASNDSLASGVDLLRSESTHEQNAHVEQAAEKAHAKRAPVKPKFQWGNIAKLISSPSQSSTTSQPSISPQANSPQSTTSSLPRSASKQITVNSTTLPLPAAPHSPTFAAAKSTPSHNPFASLTGSFTPAPVVIVPAIADIPQTSTTVASSTASNSASIPLSETMLAFTDLPAMDDHQVGVYNEDRTSPELNCSSDEYSSDNDDDEFLFQGEILVAESQMKFDGSSRRLNIKERYPVPSQLFDNYFEMSMSDLNISQDSDSTSTARTRKTSTATGGGSGNDSGSRTVVDSFTETSGPNGKEKPYIMSATGLLISCQPYVKGSKLPSELFRPPISRSKPVIIRAPVVSEATSLSTSSYAQTTPRKDSAGSGTHTLLDMPNGFAVKRTVDMGTQSSEADMELA